MHNNIGKIFIPFNNERRNFKIDKTTNITTKNNVLTKPCACEWITSIHKVLNLTCNEKNQYIKGINM